MINSINALAETIRQAYENDDSMQCRNLGELSTALSAIANTPVTATVWILTTGEQLESQRRRLPNIRCSSTHAWLKVERQDNGGNVMLAFPDSIGCLDHIMDTLRKFRSAEQQAFDAFKDRMFASLSPEYQWQVGNEDYRCWPAFKFGQFNGVYYLAYCTVVDCESGGFIDSYDKTLIPVRGDAPTDWLVCALDRCIEHYSSEYDVTDDCYIIDVQQCLDVCKDFDEQFVKSWNACALTSASTSNPNH